MKNYLAEQEGFLNKKLSCRVREKYKFNHFDPLMCNYLAEQEKNSIHAIDY
jgi:hypothetical protein